MAIKNTVFIMIILLLSIYTVLGAELKETLTKEELKVQEEQDIKGHITLITSDTKNSIDISLNEITSKISDTITKETIIQTGGVLVSFKDLEDYRDINKFEVKTQSNFSSKAVEVQGANMTEATVILEKTTPNLGRKYQIAHSKDNINFEIKDIYYEHNSTHIWFNVTEFSTWTTFIESPLILYERVQRYIDLDDYASIDETDYIGIQYTECGTTYFIDAGLGNDQVTVRDCFSQDLYDIDVIASTNEVVLYPYGDSLITDEDFAFIIFNSNGIPDISDVTGMEIQIPDNPDVATLSASTIGDTSAKLRGTFTINDYEEAIVYFEYKATSVGVWSEATRVTLSASTTFIETVTGLDSGTEYEYRLVWENPDYATETGTSTTTTFTTTTPEGVSASTLSATSITNESATLRGVVDFGDYTGDVYGTIGYATTSGSGYYTTPSTPYPQLSDDTIFSVSATGLDPDTTYYYRVFTYETSTGTAITQSSDATFTTEATPSERDTNGTVLYYTMDDDEVTGSTILDLTDNSNDGTITGATTGTTGIYQEAFNFDGNNDYVDTGMKIPVYEGSINLWVKTTQTTRADFGSGSSLGRVMYITFNRASAGELSFALGTTGVTNGISVASSGVNDGDWHMITVIAGKTNSKMAIYIDGANASPSNYLNQGTLSEDNLDLNFLIGARNNAGTIGNYLNGDVDEVAIFDYALTSDEIDHLYNSGSPGESQQYPFTTPTEESINVDTLTPGIISHDERQFKGLPIFENSAITGWYGGFRWRVNGLTAWTNTSESFDIPITNNTQFLFSVDYIKASNGSFVPLPYLADFQYQAYIYNITDSEYGNIVNFSTQAPPTPDMQPKYIASQLNITNQSVTLGGFIISEWDGILYNFRYRQSGETNWTYTDVKNISSPIETEVFEYVDGLSSDTEYEFELIGTYGLSYENTEYSGIVTFTTLETGAPDIILDGVYNIKRDEAQLSGSVESLGVYDEITVFFTYTNSSGTFLSDDTTFTLEGDGSFIPSSFLTYIENLSTNTTYTVEMIAYYDNDSRTTSGGSVDFTTLSLDDFIMPELTVFILDDNIGYNTTTVSIDVELYGINDTDLSLIYGESSGTTSQETTSIDVTEDDRFNILLTDLDSDTDYFVYGELIYTLDNGTIGEAYSDNRTFTTRDIVETPKSVELIPGFSFFVKEPYQFQMLMIMGLTIVGLGLAVGSSLRGGHEKFLIWGVFATTLIFLVWGYYQQIVGLTQLSFTLVTIIAYGVYSGLRNVRGVAYG